jgi:hypothetical protein
MPTLLLLYEMGTLYTRDNISFDIRYIHSGAVGMLLHINGKYTIGKLKSSLTVYF